MMKKKAALVCSGGGALGIAFLGIIEKLQEKYEFDFYAGVSAGALVTSLLVTGHTPKEIYQALEKTSLFQLSFDFSNTRFGLLRGEKTLKIFQELFDDKSFSDLSVPLFIGTTNFLNGQRVMLSEGSLADAVRASISVPVLFEPYFHPQQKKWLVDGGLSQNLPLDTALENYNGDTIIALDVSGLDESIDFGERKLFQKQRSISKTLGRTFKIFFQNQQTHFPSDSRVRHIRLTPPFDSIDIFKISELYSWGRDYAQEHFSDFS